MKACDTCEQRWVVDRYSGYPKVSEITISHETPETVVEYQDRGTFGASTRRRQKTNSHESVHKTELAAWEKAASELSAKVMQLEMQLTSYLARAEQAAIKVAELAQSAG